MSDLLVRLSKAVQARRGAEGEYRAALVAAVAALEAAGDPAPFARVAKVAGVSRQAVRELVTKSRAG